jgi:hypothetical protein
LRLEQKEFVRLRFRSRDRRENRGGKLGKWRRTVETLSDGTDARVRAAAVAMVTKASRGT